MASPYQTFRRVGAVVAVGLALFLIIRTTCSERSNEPVRFALDFGDRAADVRHVRVDLWTGAEADTSIGYFEADFEASGGATGPVRFSQPTPAEVTATTAVTLTSGEVETFRQTVSATPGSDVTLHLHR